MSAEKYPQKTIKVGYWGDISYHRINNDVNGNPRYVVHFLALGIEPKDYGKIPGLTMYRAKWFGGGIVFQSHNLKEDLEWHLRKVQEFYSNKA